MNQSASSALPLRAKLPSFSLSSLLMAGIAMGVLTLLPTLGTSNAWWKHEQWGTATAVAQSNLSLVIPSAAIAVLLTLAFVIARGRLLAISSGNLRQRDGMRVFVEGSCIECLAFPGVVWADVYRAGALRGLFPSTASWKHAASSLVRFRIGTLVGVASVLLLASFAGAAWHAGLAMITAGALCMVASQYGALQAKPGATTTTTSSTMLPASPSLLRLSRWGVLGSLLHVASAAMVVWMIAGVSPLAFAPLFVLVSIAATATTLPLGLGFAEVGGWWVLTRMLGVDSATAALSVATYRIAGPGLLVALGAASLALRAARGATMLANLRQTAIDEMQAIEQDRLTAARTHTATASPIVDAGTTPVAMAKTTLVESKFVTESTSSLARAVPHFTPPPMHKPHAMPEAKPMTQLGTIDVS